MDNMTFAGTSKAADAPNIEPAIYDARFDGISTKMVEGGDYGTGSVQKGADGNPYNKFVWQFTLLDDDGAVLYDEGEPVELDGLTSLSLNVVSKTKPKAVKYFQAIMTPAEFAAFEAGEGVAASELVGRVVQVEVAVRDSGWPTIANVLAPRKRRVSAGRAVASPAEAEA